MEGAEFLDIAAGPNSHLPESNWKPSVCKTVSPRDAASDMVRFAGERTGMTLSVSLSAPTEAKLKKRAAAAGTDPAEYARVLIEREMLAAESFDEILRPARESFRKSGATEAQLDRAVSRARKAISRRKVRRGKPK